MAATSPNYCSIEDYGIIGDMHTCALVSKNGGLDFMCWPAFDSPSVFCRVLDNNKGGHFTIRPAGDIKPMSKQRYRAGTNVLETRWIHEDGVITLSDYFPVLSKKPSHPGGSGSAWCSCDTAADGAEGAECRSGVVRKVECVRGQMDMVVEVFPAFNYALDEHTGQWVTRGDPGNRLNEYLFESATQSLQLSILTSPDPSGEGSGETPKVSFEIQDRPGMKGPEHDTAEFWAAWINQCTFRGHYREQVERSLLILKLLTYKPTGAIVASPTFSLPESIGGPRNWDYRYSWVRDAAFVVYVFLKNGYPKEAESYINFIFDRVFPPANGEHQTNRPFLPIMVTIHGEHDIPESELDHLEGYMGSKPVRIGNGAASHTQLDIFGELMDSVYLYHKHGRPISYDQWLAVRRMTSHVMDVLHETDRSIWEVRGKPQNFVYSKIMLWVALDRALRLAEKRSNLPCPDRIEWLRARDDLYDEIMTKGYNFKDNYFCMSYESPDILDAAVLIAPLVFFIAPNDPRFLNTLKRVMLPQAKGGLSMANMVSRYDHTKVDDGVGGREGAFVMVTFWLVEAMMRASKAMSYNVDDPFYRQLRKLAITHFDNMLSFANHLGMFSEEVAISGEQIGNTPQAFSHLACISAAMNLGGGD
ncbi:Glycosyl hydrolases family 15 [Aspergillus parasiticus SU-1]|uniref:Glycosyl hydrolases family 15 n=1 Tax=Aspergillus parasiticus (strain ATCC 56775 / NRRL 5862 / SRRC 143 / SU-1) TaxID=1403190 RepID=A0A0F0I891_ASPPU|nr:Glycosyl hydrolases family 15 [Aspergillus parasiticus SU-1]